MPSGAVPGYATRFQHIAVAGGQPLEIRALLDNQQYADPLGAAAAAGISPASWALFGLIWPSAQKLADLMQAWEFGKRRVLEIGCGLALASMVVHRRGGTVTASDRHPLAADFLRANLLLNQLPTLPYRVGNWETANPALGRFDLIIGSDLLYEPDPAGRLAAFIECHAEAAAEVLIIDPDRGNRGAFKHRMDALGFGLSETRLLAPLHDGVAYHGRLLHYRRGASADSRGN